MKFTLKIGPEPVKAASPQLLLSLSKAEITQTSDAPSVFQLVFSAGRYALQNPTSAKEWPVLDGGELQPFNRAQISVQVGRGKPKVLIDGFITRQEVNVKHGEDGVSSIVVTGEDIGVKMDLFEISAEYKDLTTSAVVKKILGKYSSLGITPDVKTPDQDAVPTDYVLQQNTTDRFFLQTLAAQNGFLFYVQPGTQAGKNKAYWGPPVTTGSAQGTLKVNLGTDTNVHWLSASYDALAATLAYGQVLDMSKKPAEPFAVAIGRATQRPDLSRRGAIPSTPAPSGLARTPTSFSSNLKQLAVRGRLANYPGYPPAEAQAIAQAKTNRSVTDVVTVEGELDAGDFGAALTAPGLVDLAGAGTYYNGTYYIKEITHRMDFELASWQFRQKFVLTRGGLGKK